MQEVTKKQLNNDPNPGASGANSPRGVGFSAFLMAAGTFSSRILGLLRDVLFAMYFDRMVTDAWLVAFRVPNLFRRILGEGAFSMAVVPALVAENRAATNRDGVAMAEQEAKTRDSLYFTLTAALVVTLSVGFFFIPEIIAALTAGDGYSQIPGKVELTTQFAYIMFGFLFFISNFAFAMAILNSRKIFGPPGFAPVFFNIAIILSVFVPNEMQSYPGQSLAYGVLVGGFLQAAFVWIYLIRLKIMPRLRPVWTPAAAGALKNMLPAVASMGVVQLTGVINVYFASRLPQGTHTWLYLADRLLELPMSLVAVSLGSAVLPSLSGLAASSERDTFHNSLFHALRINLFLILPCAVAIFFYSEPIVQLLFARGRFVESDVVGTVLILRLYAGLLVLSGFTRVFVASFYALKDTRFPAYVAGVCLILHVLLAPSLIDHFGLEGLVYSTLITSLVQLSLLKWRYHFAIRRLNWKDYSAFVSFIPASVAIGLLMAFNPLTMIFGVGKLTTILTLCAVVLVYFLISDLLKLKELEPIRRRIRAKMMR